MLIYLPIAEMAVPAELILLLGTVVGLMSGIFGVGGGFLTTPFLIFMGVPPTIAVGTQGIQLVAASVSGVLAHWKRGNVDTKLGLVMLGGSVLGTIIGILVFKLLEYLGQIDVVISILYVFLLGSMGIMMMVESIYALVKKKASKKEEDEISRFQAFIQKWPYKMRFPRSRLYISALLPAGIGFIGGFLVSIMGIGGGFLLVPAMIYLLGMPTLLVAGTSLFQIIFSAAFAAMLHAVANNTLDIVLALLLVCGGVIGAQIGVRLARYIKGAPARVLLAFLLLMVCFRLGLELFIKPEDLFTTVLTG